MTVDHINFLLEHFGSYFNLLFEVDFSDTDSVSASFLPGEGRSPGSLDSLQCVCLVAQSCSTLRTLLYSTVLYSWTVAHQEPLSMDSPGKNTGVGYYSLLQGTVPTQD